jgi:hypothetical protein
VGNLGITLEEDAELLWDALLDWQSVYFELRDPQKVLVPVNEAQGQLGRRVIDAAPTAEADLEFYTNSQSTGGTGVSPVQAQTKRVSISGSKAPLNSVNSM